MPIISGTAVARSTLAGYEIGYDQITANVNLTGTTEGTATTIITCAAHSFDGGLVLVEFYANGVRTGTPAGNDVVIGIFESGTLINRIGEIQNPGAGATNNVGPFHTVCRFTPSAASHSYVIAGWVSAATGTPSVFAGTGGPGNNPPAWVRFTKV